jgi:hypothetical protein
VKERAIPFRQEIGFDVWQKLKWRSGMSRYLKCLSEMATCGVFYSAFHYVEKQQVISLNFLTIETWKDDLKADWSRGAIQITSVALQAGVAFIGCRTASPMISNMLFNRHRNYDSQMILAALSTATSTLTKQRPLHIAVYGGMFLTIYQSIILALIWKKTPSDHWREVIDSRWFPHLPTEVILDTFLFSSYLFCRLHLLAGPLVASLGTAVSYAASHTVRHYDVYDKYQGPATLVSDFFTALCAQGAYQMSGSLILPCFFYALSKSLEVVTSVFLGDVETGSEWRSFLNSTLKAPLGSVTTNIAQVFCLGQIGKNSLAPQSPEETLAIRQFLEKYIHIYLSQEPPAASSSSWSQQSDQVEINWEELADILYNFRAIASLTLYQELTTKAISFREFYQLQDISIKVSPPGVCLSPLITIDHLYLKTLKYFNTKPKKVNITREDLMTILAGELQLFAINSERLKRFEENFIEMTSLWDLSSKNHPHPLSEDQVAEMVDQYYQSIAEFVLTSTLCIPLKDRIGSLPKYPEAISEGLTVSSLPSLAARYSRSNDHTNALAMGSFQHYCIASRRGALVALDHHGLTIRKWNILLAKAMKQFPKVEEKNKKWLDYLNGEEFEEKIRNYDPSIKGERETTSTGL